MLFIYDFLSGEMAERSKAHAWKVCIRQKRIMGSNPILSAIKYILFRFFYTFKFLISFMAINKEIISKIFIGFNIFMIAIFFLVGFLFIYSPIYPFIPRNMKLIFGGFFIAYGVFRLARFLQHYKEQKRKEYKNE